MSGAAERLAQLLLHPPEGEAPEWLGEALLLSWDVDKDVRQADFKLERLQKDKAMLSSLLTKTTRDLDESLLAQKRFLASVSHEIRTPLNAITGFIELLRDTPLNDKQKEFIENSLTSSRHLLALINDVLDISKIEAGQLEFTEEEVLLEDLLLDAVVLTSTKVGNSAIRLLTDIPNLNYFVLADPVRIKQIFINLLSNAIKFTEEGHVRLALLGAEEAGEMVRFNVLVEDTGIGIPADKIDSLFRPFKQAHASRYGGTGLGLYLSRSLARLMGGDVALESHTGNGSRFQVTFNLRKGRSKELAFDFSGYTILTGTGDDALLQDLSGKLCAAGAVALPLSATGKIVEALDCCRNYPTVQAAILDIELFGGKCHYFAELVRELFPGIFILGVTRREEGRVISEFDSLLAKPFSFHKLANVIHGALHNRRHADRGNLPRLAGLKVLVVDDIEVNVLLAREMLAAYFNITPDVARDGEEALSKVRETGYDIVFMDIQMPCMDGITATREIRKFNQGVPIVGLSANAFAEDVEKAREAGMNGYIVKPVKKEELEKVLLGLGRGRQNPSEMEVEGELKQVTKQEAQSGDSLRQLAIDHLTREYGDEIAASVMGVSVESLKNVLVDIEQGFGSEDAGKVRTGFHSLKGLFLALGLDEPGKLSAGIEAALKADGALDAARDKGKDVFDFARRFMAELDG